MGYQSSADHNDVIWSLNQEILAAEIKPLSAIFIETPSFLCFFQKGSSNLNSAFLRFLDIFGGL